MRRRCTQLSSLCPSPGASTRGRTWLQINLALPPRDARPVTTILELFDEFFPLVDELAGQDKLSCFHFARKPPGVRLRFALNDLDRQPGDAVRACADGLVARRLATRWFPSVYEPESFKFGGPVAIEAVHDYFAADCRAWWCWEHAAVDALTDIDARLLSASVLNDLFGQFCNGPEEVWDVWCHIAALHGESILDGGERPTAPTIERLVSHASSPVLSVLRAYSAANQALAARFRELLDAGLLLFAHRQVLPHLTLHHWNRYGFAPTERASMFTLMMQAWSPLADRLGRLGM
jgi:thiopeptide-type bacteriocin biosynthesis protein